MLQYNPFSCLGLPEEMVLVSATHQTLESIELIDSRGGMEIVERNRLSPLESERYPIGQQR